MNALVDPPYHLPEVRKGSKAEMRGPATRSRRTLAGALRTRAVEHAGANRRARHVMLFDAE